MTLWGDFAVCVCVCLRACVFILDCMSEMSILHLYVHVEIIAFRFRDSRNHNYTEHHRLFVK